MTVTTTTTTAAQVDRCYEYTGHGGVDFISQDFVHLSDDESMLLFEDSYHNGVPRLRAAYDVMMDQAAFAWSGALERF